MWCPECDKEFDAAALCPDCGGELREKPEAEWGGDSRRGVSERWPKGEDGQPVPPVYLAHRTGLSMDDAMLVSLLEAYGIPALRQYPDNGDFGRVIIGLSGAGVDIFVPETMLEEARALTEGGEEDVGI